LESKQTAPDMVRRLLLAFLGLCLVWGVFQTQYYRLRKRKAADNYIVQELSVQAEKALEKLEVPVGAVLTYKDSIIGRGFNTVLRDSNLTAHAEMNALIDAYKRFRAGWSGMDKNQLIMYSTYEPCEMCKGAMLTFGIKKAVFEGPKPASSQVKTTAKSWIYEMQKERFFAPGLQDSLFLRHPDYPEKK
jgi:tRNA(Arg) A34 adenosine deaminase TadA